MSKVASKVAGQVEVQSSSVIWKVDGFSKQCKGNRELVKSPNFEFNDSKKKTFWNLLLFPYGDTSDVTDYLSIFLNFSPKSTISECEILCEISLLGDSRIDTSTTQKSAKLVYDGVKTWGWRKFIQRSELLKKEDTLLKGDVLSILCYISLIPIYTLEHELSSLADQFDSLLKAGDFDIVTIAIDDREIKVHKAILSARSEVFAAILKDDMTEDNTITITDVEVDVMEMFLSFLYSGEINDIEKFAKCLLPVAIEYDVQDLKQLCESSLFDGLTVDNACEVVCLAELYGCSELQSKIVDYMIKNMGEIIKTEGFDHLSSSNQTLFKEIFCKLVQSNNNEK